MKMTGVYRMPLSILKIMTLLFQLSDASENKEFLPPETLFKFAVDVTQFWNFEDMIIVDTFSNYDDDSTAKVVKFTTTSPKISGYYVSSMDAVKSAADIFNIMSKRAMVTIINNDDQEYFDTFSVGQLESSTWFIPDTMNMSKTALRLDSNLYIFSKLANSSITLHEVYAVKGGPIIKQPIGSWNPIQGVEVNEPSPWDRRKDLSSITIRNSIIINKGYPVLVSRLDDDNKTIHATAYFPEMLDLLSEVMGFKVLLVVPADGLFGSMNKDGTWNGMVGMLQKGEADICAGGLATTMERQEVIDFNMPLMKIAITFLLMNPSGQGTLNVWAYLETFSVISWIVTFVTLAALTLALCCYGRYTTDSCSEPDRFGLMACIGFMFTIFLQRDQPLSHNQHSTRLIVLVASMFCYLIFTYYSTILTSFMTVPEPAIQINSFYDILKYDYHVMTLKGSIYETFLKGAKPPSVFYDIYTKDMKDRKDAFPPTYAAMLKVLQDNPKTGLFGPDSMSYTFDGLVTLKLPEALSGYVSFGLRKNSEFTKMFDYHLLKMSQSGVMARVYSKWFNKTSFETGQGDDEIIVLDYYNLIFPCLVLAVGMGLSLVLVLAEKCARSWKMGAW